MVEITDFNIIEDLKIFKVGFMLYKNDNVSKKISQPDATSRIIAFFKVMNFSSVNSKQNVKFKNYSCD